MNKKILAAATVAALALTLTGCGASTSAKTGDGQVSSRFVVTPDGRQVACVFWVPIDNTGVATAEGAQMDCDWAGAK